MVSAANPYAVEAAARVLRAGGHAVDAAIAAHAVLGLVEPQSSGIGGGAFLLAYEHGGRLLAYDGRETAPAAVSGDLFMAAGESLGFMQAWQSGRSVGTPGTVALYAAVNEELGRLTLAEVLAPAIELAREGFEVSPRLATFLVRARDVIRLDENPDTAAYFYPDGEALTPGTIRTNPAYAETLSRIAQQGPDAFYRGTLAQQIVDAVRAEPLPGTLTLEDLADYRIQRRDALCGAVQALRVWSWMPGRQKTSCWRQQNRRCWIGQP
jgi:gamma-glutamyltranspeptidase/glutathione hydrolase